MYVAFGSLTSCISIERDFSKCLLLNVSWGKTGRWEKKKVKAEADFSRYCHCCLLFWIKATNVTLRSQIEDLLNRQYLCCTMYCVHVLHMYYTCVSTVEVTTLMLSLYLRFTTKLNRRGFHSTFFLGNFPLLFKRLGRRYYYSMSLLHYMNYRVTYKIKFQQFYQM